MTQCSSYLHTLRVSCVLFVLCAVYNGVAEDVCRPNGIQHVDDADVRFALMLQLRDRSNDQWCSITSNGLQDYLAVDWLLERINSYDNGTGYIPGIKMGYTSFDDCGESIYSARNSISFFNDSLPYMSATCQGQSRAVPDIAIVGPSSSSSSIAISSLVKDFPMPIISPMATVAELSEKSLHPTFFRTVPSDEQQILLIVDLLEQLQWTYIAIAYQNDDYGISGRNILVQKAKEKGICVYQEELVLSRQDGSNIANHFERVLKAAQSNSIGVVVIADSFHTERLLYEVEMRVSNYKRGLHFVLTTMVNTDISVFKTKEQGQGTLSISTASELTDMDDLKTHLNEKFEQFKSQQSNNDHQDPLIQEYVDTHGQPSVFVRDSLDPLLPSTINAVMALVESFKGLHRQECGVVPGMCQALSDALKTGGLLKHLRAVQVNYSDIPETIVPSAFRENRFSFSFNANGDIDIGSLNPSLTIHSFDANTENYKQVGSYTNEGGVDLEVEEIEWLSPLGDPLQGIPTSMCGEESCGTCRDNDVFPVMHLPGEVYIMGIFSLHDPDSNDLFKCGDYRRISNDAIVAEGFLFAVNDLRARTGIEFGVIGVDACYSQLRITNILTDLFSDKMTPLYSQIFPGETTKTLREKVVGVVGPLSSGCTIPAARFLTPLNIPVITYAASSPDLDDKIDFPLFMRTVPSDVEQARAMVNIIKKMGWERVGLLYVNNNYGAKGMKAFRSIVDVEGSGICTPKEIAISDVKTVDDVDLFEASRMLLSQSVKVVVFFGTDSRARDLIKNFEEYNRWGRFIFLASEDWGTNEGIKDAGPNSARGTITLKLQTMGLESEDAFKEHLSTKEPSYDDKNVWYREFLQARNECRFKGSFYSESLKECDPGLKLTPSQVKQGVEDQRTRHAMNAVYALGKGLNASRDRYCKLGLSGCDYLKSNAPGVVELIKKQTRKEGSKQLRVFDSNGNGDLGYDVYNIQPVGVTNKYVNIGKCDPDCDDLSGVKFYDKYDEVPSLSAVCEKGQCTQCQHIKAPPPPPEKEETDDNSMTDFRDSDILIISLVCVLILAVAVGALAICLCYRTRCNKDVIQKNTSNEEYYEQIRTAYPSHLFPPSANLPVSNPDISPYVLCNTLNRNGVANPTFLSDSDRIDSVSQARGMNIDNNILYGSTTTSGNMTTNQYSIRSVAPTTPSSRPPEKYTSSMRHSATVNSDNAGHQSGGNETDGSLKYVNDPPPPGVQRQSSVVYSSLAASSLPLNAKNLQAVQNAIYGRDNGGNVVFTKDANGQLVAYVTSSEIGQQPSQNLNLDRGTASQAAGSVQPSSHYGPYSYAAAIQQKQKDEQIPSSNQEYPSQNTNNPRASVPVIAGDFSPPPNVNDPPRTPYENIELQNFNFMTNRDSSNYQAQIEQLQQQQQQQLLQQQQQQLLLLQQQQLQQQQQQQQQQSYLSQPANQNFPLQYAVPTHLISAPSTFSTAIPMSSSHLSTMPPQQQHSILQQQQQQSRPFSEPVSSANPRLQMIDPALQQHLWMAQLSNQTVLRDDQYPPNQDQWQEGGGEEDGEEEEDRSESGMKGQGQGHGESKGLYTYPESNHSLSSIPDVISGQMPQQPPTPLKSPRDIQLESIDLDANSVSDHEQELDKSQQKSHSSGRGISQQNMNNVTSVV